MFSLTKNKELNRTLKQWNWEMWADLFIKAIKKAKKPIPDAIHKLNNKIYR